MRARTIKPVFLWLFALLAFFLYLQDALCLGMAGMLLAAMAISVTVLYFWGLWHGGAVFFGTTILYVLMPFGFLLSGEMRDTLVSVCAKAALYVAEYGVSGDLFHRLSAGASGTLQAGTVDTAAFLLACLWPLLWGTAVFALLERKAPMLFFALVAASFALPFLVWGICPSLPALVCFFAFCVLFFCPSVPAGLAGAACFALLVAGGSFLSGENAATSGVQKAWNARRYQENAAVLPEGDLARAVKMERDDTEALVVSEGKRDGYYLRGFVGAVYADNAWKGSEERIDLFGNSSDMLAATGQLAWGSLAWLHGKGFFGGNALYHIARQNRIAEEKATPSLYDFAVKNMGANRRYLYLPYETATAYAAFSENGTAALNRQEGLRASGLFGADTYAVRTMENLAGQLSADALWQESEGQTAEKTNLSTYGEYVTSTCLYVGKQTKTTLSEAVGAPLKGTVSANYAIDKVKRWLKENVTYEENPGAIPDGEDFAAWFFREKKGYDVQYAAAATLLLRYYGIPARYVEGYLLTPETVEKAGDTAAISVTQRYAHAWTEVYLENCGWIPIEVTPKYEKVMGTPYTDFTGERAVSHAGASDDALTEDDAKKSADTTEEKDKEKNNEKESPQDAPQDDEGDAYSETAAKTGRRILRGALLLLFLLLLLALFLFRKRLLIWYLTKKTDRLLERKNYAEAVEIWHRALRRSLYGAREKHADNRTRNFERDLAECVPELDRRQFRNAMAIRQKAVYAPRGITRREAMRAVRFFKEQWLVVSG